METQNHQGCSSHGSCSKQQTEQNSRNQNTAQANAQSMIKESHPLSHVKKVIGVVSGKGGVGKSLVTSLLAIQAQRNGLHSAILDADITGPSIPKAFGIKDKIGESPFGLYPLKTKNGISVMSLNLLLPNETDPVIWRSPIITSTATQFWTDVIWADVDYMFVDMPPGTGDIALTIFQSLPLSGIVIVASPQELVGMIVEKALNMASIMNIPVLGLVENMSYLECDDCGKKIKVFGESHIDAIAEKFDIKHVVKIPLNPNLANACDTGTIEDVKGDWLEKLFISFEALPNREVN